MDNADLIKKIKGCTTRYGTPVPTAAAREIADMMLSDLDAYRQFTADVMAIWANWTSGRLGEEDAMTAIADRHTELRATFGDS
ncbi:hypothetical protein [Streptomyces malaysiensis]|uniref:Uncharacterized protein n=1 Tax=Streptomyces malaysiensis subsp. samsunensis TaxID=459658 RepID=A0A9X2LWD8_STRMQ|nr:hypothetical protein [Streptomyces samsunensis]MCQ8831815.1 hypothetical protein [Streptomyces samsunensis]